VQGRITERELPLAEKSFPGISEMYGELEEKPVTFLQLVWMYQDRCAARCSAAPAAGRARKAPRRKVALRNAG
jgi:hypothetical protein